MNLIKEERGFKPLTFVFTGYIYKCTTGGAASSAKWAYVSKFIDSRLGPVGYAHTPNVNDYGI